jgi:hypothetical protein
MHAFYDIPKSLQWIAALFIAALGFYPALVILESAYDHPSAYLLFFIYLPLGQFSLAPIMTLTGVYVYYSPMLIGYVPTAANIDMHSGTSFDYLFLMRKYKPGPETRNALLGFYLEGLLNIIQKIETGEIPATVSITGTSYFFNERTAKKFGFSVEPPPLFLKMNIWANGLDLFWMYSLSQGKVAFPDFGEIKKVATDGNTLVAHKGRIQGLFDALHNKSTSAAA